MTPSGTWRAGSSGSRAASSSCRSIAEAAHRILAPLVDRVVRSGIVEAGAVRFVPDDVEALIRLGGLDEAEATLEWFERCAKATGRHSALAAAGRCRGLLRSARGDLAGALTALEEAVDEHDRVPMPFALARTLLAAGATRRRAKEKRAARESIEVAGRTFARLGASLWLRRAEEELARIGGRVPAASELTATERRVAELVAGGLRNKEVAAALFVTVKTVEATLSRVYAKLGVRSRTELARTFAEHGSPRVPRSDPPGRP